MSFVIRHRYGKTERNPSLSELPKLLRELEDRLDDVEHTSVSLTHESEWDISVSHGGYVIFEHLENGGERHMRGLSQTKILDLWQKLATGKIEELQTEPWIPGY